MLQTRKNVLDKARTELADTVNKANKIYTNEELSTLVTEQQSLIETMKNSIDTLNNSVIDLNKKITNMNSCTELKTVDSSQFENPSNFTAGKLEYYKCGNTVTVQLGATVKNLGGNGCINVFWLPYASKMDLESPVHGNWGKSISGSIAIRDNLLLICQYQNEEIVDAHGTITFSVSN